ncbi:hypothetical protein [Sphaerotilus microaerophilus]|uniref:TerD domain-containing protein n=1 Tax=Sphaerotilus microaerophilus TaxID=2914710 RepID=A0ABN6PIF0_9BURK|nr:hypothetical protein [Sphaerotilus sp. FB-5]BDI04718.1 hypothetical protein CATMQ487_16880 [Sphaerotilus sp. FB-5]
MSSRADQILARFPLHLDAARRGKRLGEATAALAQDLDTLAAALAAVRRAHRLADADEMADLLRLAALHGMGRPEFEVLLQRQRRTRVLLAALQVASDDATRTATADALLALWAPQAPAPRLLPLYADPDAPDDTARAAQRLAAQVVLTLRQARLNDALRGRIARSAAIATHGNGTVQALMEAAANALDLAIGPIQHSADRFWHAARVTDRLRLARPTADASVELQPADELLGLEENPLERSSTDATPRRHAELFTLTRRGFERALLRVQITGEADRSVAPMLVNRDEGHGIGYDARLAAGAELMFQEDGRVLLDGADVTANAFAWQGACFAGDDASEQADFVFAGSGLGPRQKPARFATFTPPAALDREAAYPSDGASLPMPGIAVGVTRLAFFVREAHAAALAGSPAQPRVVTPRHGQAIFDASVFAAPPLPNAPAARVALSWLEHRAFAVRVLIPPRLRLWRDGAEDPDGVLTLQAVARALERHRPAGVELRVEYIDERWILGQGTLTSGIDDDLIEQLRSGMVLWRAPAQPAPA